MNNVNNNVRAENPPEKIRTKWILANQIAILTILALGCIQLIAIPYLGARGILPLRHTVVLVSTLSAATIIALTCLFTLGPRYPSN